MNPISIRLSGDTSLSVEFGKKISPETNRLIRSFHIALGKSGIPGIVESVPTYCAVMVHYDPELIRCAPLVSALEHLFISLDSIDIPPAPVIEIPVLYGGDGGPDLGFVASYNRLSRDEVIDLHCGRDYLIYMLGFTPGFCYLGGMDKRIATPRLQTPRTEIPAGSVGIAGEQTGIYPIASPGGWQLIGLTPVKLYDAARETPILLSAGSYIRFSPVDRAEFERIAALAADGRYDCRILGMKD